jgi:hypothetical protein
MSDDKTRIQQKPAPSPPDATRVRRISDRFGFGFVLAATMFLVVGVNSYLNRYAWGLATELSAFGLTGVSLSAHSIQQLSSSDWLLALAKTDSSLYFVLMQGLQDFLALQLQTSNSKAFADLQKRLFGQPRLAATNPGARMPSRPDTCQLRLANLGKQRGSRCRDLLFGSTTGPELVVIKAGDMAPFAITRREISVAEFNLFCLQMRQCREQPQGQLPMTGVTAEQVQRYAQWLSSSSSFRYRLPTLSEWQLIARDDSGVPDHNCVLNAGGRTVRGNQLRSADEGYANSLGLLNLFGNAEELVQQGNRIIAVGGAATTEISRCNGQYRNENAGDANAFRGFRLVRELKNAAAAQ